MPSWINVFISPTAEATGSIRLKPGLQNLDWRFSERPRVLQQRGKADVQLAYLLRYVFWLRRPANLLYFDARNFSE